MAKVGAQRAAVLTGKSKSTIQRAMNSGKLSYELDQNKRRIIDVSELERVFGIVQTAPQPTPAQKSAPAAPKEKDVESLIEKERMEMQIKMLEQQLSTAEEQIDDLRDQRNKWEKQASQMLITSQYSQRQAEELRTQIREREERARQRRMQNTKMQSPQTSSSSSNVSRSDSVSGAAPVQRPVSRKGKDLDSQMQKLKAENENVTQTSASVFRFWKKAKG